MRCKKALILTLLFFAISYPAGSEENTEDVLKKWRETRPRFTTEEQKKAYTTELGFYMWRIWECQGLFPKIVEHGNKKERQALASYLEYRLRDDGPFFDRNWCLSKKVIPPNFKPKIKI